MKSVLTGTPVQELQDNLERQKVLNKYTLRHSTIEDLESFHAILETSYKKIVNLVGEFKLSLEDSPPVNSKPVHVSRSMAKINNTISVEFKTNIALEAISSGEPLVDYSLDLSIEKSYVKYNDYKKELVETRKSNKEYPVAKSEATFLRPERFLVVSKKKEKEKTKEAPISTNPKRSKKGSPNGPSVRIDLGSVKVVETYDKYLERDLISKSKVGTLIDSLMLRPSTAGDISKEDMPSRERLWANLDASTTFGLSKGGIEPFSDIRKFYETEAFKKIEPLLDEGFKRSLCESAHNNIKKEKFLEKMEEERYKDLETMRDKIGSIYDYMQKLFVINRNINQFPKLFKRKSFKKRYFSGLVENETILDDPRITMDPFESEAREAREISASGLHRVPLNIENTDIDLQPGEISNSAVRKVIFVKYESRNAEPDQPVPTPVNNGVLLEL